MCIDNGFSCTTITSAKVEINSLNNKKIVASFDGGVITSDAGAVLLQVAEKNVGIISGLAHCLRDRREQGKITHTITDMLTQLVTQIACGYEDLNDSHTLRHDPVFKLINDEAPHSGKSLASAPTLCRFENGVTATELLNIGNMFIERFVESKKQTPPHTITIDLDATEDETYGQQEFSFYHGYYRCYCFLPLIVTACCDDEEEFEPIAAVLRPGNVHASHGCVALLKRIVTAVRKAFPGVRLIVRGDCGFAIPALYCWLEAHDVDYVIGYPRNARLMEAEAVREAGAQADAWYEEEGEKVRLFTELWYAADSWDASRRIIYKAERTQKGENNRFLVTNIIELAAQDVYDTLYTRRGQMENRIKELKSCLKMDRTSCSSFQANQFRVFLVFATFLLFQHLRRCLRGTAFEHAQVDMLRTRFLKIGARVTETARRIWLHFSSAYPLQHLFWQLLTHPLCSAPAG